MAFTSTNDLVGVLYQLPAPVLLVSVWALLGPNTRAAFKQLCKDARLLAHNRLHTGRLTTIAYAKYIQSLQRRAVKVHDTFTAITTLVVYLPLANVSGSDGTNSSAVATFHSLLSALGTCASLRILEVHSATSLTLTTVDCASIAASYSKLATFSLRVGESSHNHAKHSVASLTVTEPVFLTFGSSHTSLTAITLRAPRLVLSVPAVESLLTLTQLQSLHLSDSTLLEPLPQLLCVLTKLTSFCFTCTTPHPRPAAWCQLLTTAELSELKQLQHIHVGPFLHATTSDDVVTQALQKLPSLSSVELPTATLSYPAYHVLSNLPLVTSLRVGDIQLHAEQRMPNTNLSLLTVDGLSGRALPLSAVPTLLQGMASTLQRVEMNIDASTGWKRVRDVAAAVQSVPSVALEIAYERLPVKQLAEFLQIVKHLHCLALLPRPPAYPSELHSGNTLQDSDLCSLATALTTVTELQLGNCVAANKGLVAIVGIRSLRQVYLLPPSGITSFPKRWKSMPAAVLQMALAAQQDLLICAPVLSLPQVQELQQQVEASSPKNIVICNWCASLDKP